MNVQSSGRGPIVRSANCETEKSLSVGGLRCTLKNWAFSGTHAYDIVAPQHHFVAVRELYSDGRIVNAGSFDGRHYAPRVLRAHDAFFVPMGGRWSGRSAGNARLRVLEGDLDQSVFAQLLGADARTLDLTACAGATSLGPRILERLEALCLTPEAFPRAYADALAVVVMYELVRAYATQPFAPRTGAGPSRFGRVLDRVEAGLEGDLRLADLAALVGLSVSRFSHAFTAAHGVAPHRYILARRIERAKELLRTSDSTVASISARVGFTSQSRFSRSFLREVGIAPSAYRRQPSFSSTARA
jgi:AraC family transcriptional regulator